MCLGTSRRAGHGAREISMATRNSTPAMQHRTVRNRNGSATGAIALATMKPVDQIRMNSAANPVMRSVDLDDRAIATQGGQLVGCTGRKRQLVYRFGIAPAALDR